MQIEIKKKKSIKELIKLKTCFEVVVCFFKNKKTFLYEVSVHPIVLNVDEVWLITKA